MSQPTLDQVLALRSIAGGEAPVWSPDGRRIAFVSSLGSTPELWSVDVETGVLQQLTTGLGGVGHLATFLPRWSPSGEYIACVSAKTGHDEVWLWSDATGELTQLTRLGGRIEAINWAPDGSWMVVAGNRRGTFDIYRVDVPSGDAMQLTASSTYSVYPSVTPDDRVLYVELDEDWIDHDVILADRDGDDARVVQTDRDFFDYHYGRTFGYPTISPDGQTFLFRSHRSGWINIWAAPVEGGEPWQVAPAEADQSDAAWSPDGHLVAYIENHDGTLDLRVVGANGGDPRVLVAPELGVAGAPAWSPDGRRIAYLLGTPTSPNDLWLVDVASGVRRRLTQSSLGGGFEASLAVPEKVVYPSFDELAVSAYLYRPTGASADNPAPLIMWIHGGPTSQFLDTLQPAVQYFVTQGYALLLPNIRGSSGYGRFFEDLNNQDWGHGDLQDVMAAIDFLRDDPTIDTDNVGITGTSYGGIMAMAATVRAPAGVFRAAIACSGYGDFVHLAEEEELRHQKLMDYEYGKLPEAIDVYYRCSPIYHVAQAATPCFVLHGEGRYPGSSGGRDFALALERNYKPVWYKTYPGETYYVAGAANVRRQLLDMQAFFDFHLRGVPYNFPDDATRPLTHLSGVIPGASRSYAPPARPSSD